MEINLNLMNGIGDNFDDFMKEQGLYEEAKDPRRNNLTDWSSYFLIA
jgi:hypothetical protein